MTEEEQLKAFLYDYFTNVRRFIAGYEELNKPQMVAHLQDLESDLAQRFGIDPDQLLTDPDMIEITIDPDQEHPLVGLLNDHAQSYADINMDIEAHAFTAIGEEIAEELGLTLD